MPEEPEIVDVPLHNGPGARTLSYRKGSSDERSINHVFERHDYNIKILQRWPEIADFLNSQREAGKRPLVIDAGANVGAASLYFSLRFPNARIVAIEPESENFKLLAKNTEGLDIRLEQAALSSMGGYSSIEEAAGGYWAYRTKPTENAALGVPNITMNEIYEQECSDTVYPFMVKMDIEGAEDDVFGGDISWLDKTPILIIEPHEWIMPRSGSFKKVLRALLDRDRDFIIETENVFSVKYDLG